MMGGSITPSGEALETFTSLTKATTTGRIAMLTTASGDPIQSAKLWSSDFQTAGYKSVEIPIVICREDAHDQKVLDIISNCDGIFLGGGDQVKLVSILAGTPLEDAIYDAHLAGIPVCGTSAGAAALSKTTLAGNEVDASGNLIKQYIGPGLGFIGQQTIVDTHFSQRRRLYRLFVAIAQFPELLGLGIDEDTALIVNGDTADVVGAGGVTFIDGRNIKFANTENLLKGGQFTLSAMRVGIAGAGHSFDLRTRELIFERL